MPRLLTPILFASLLACSSGASAPAPRTVASPASSSAAAAPDAKVSPAAAACPEQVAAMHSLFSHGPGDSVIINMPPGMELPTARGGEPVGDGMPVFVLASGGFRFNEQMHPTVAELRTALDKEFDKMKQLNATTGAPFRASLLLVVDARVPASTVLELTDGVPPEVTLFQVVQLAGDIAPPAPPTPPAVQKVLDNPRADLRAVELARTIETAMGGCKPIGELFQQLATMDIATRGKTLLRSLPGAVDACQCEGIDLDVLVSAVWQMSGKTSPSKRQFPLLLARDAKAEQVRLPANATAADLALLVGARGTTPFRLELAK